MRILYPLCFHFRKKFSSVAAIVIPILTTTAASAIAQTTATSGGSISSDGGAAITAKGVCWSTSATPTIADSKTIDGTGTTTFTSSLTGLTASTIYYIRAYATNSAGTAYGTVVSFTSALPLSLPVLTTTAVTAIAQTTATGGGNISSDGNAAITARGVCWSTSATPTIADSKTDDATGTGSFTSAITGLTAGTMYYVRAYATNSVGTAYGTAVSFTTSEVVPVATTYYVSTTGNDTTGDGTVSTPWATLAKAVTVVTTPGDIIHMVAGTHTINSAVNLPIGINLEGDGITSIITTTTLTADYQPIITLNSATIANGNQSVSYLKFDGAAMTASQALWCSKRHGVKIHHCTFIDFHYIAVYWVGDGGSETVAPTTYLTGSEFHDNIVTNCAGYTSFFKGAIFIGGHDGMLIYNNTMTETGRVAGQQGWPIKIWANGGWMKGMKIYNNTLFKDDVSVWDFAIEALWIYGAEIYGNTITGSIDINHTIKSTYDYGLYIHNNTIGPATAQAGYYSGIRPEFDTESLIVEFNEFRNCAIGIKYSPRTGNVILNNRISYNLFRDLGAGNAAHYYSGIRMDEGTYTVTNYFVYNNTFHTPIAEKAYYGIAMQPSAASNLNFINNIFINFNSRWLTSNFGTIGADTVNVKNNDLYNNGNTNLINLGTGTPTNYVYTGNINDVPLFVSASDFSLQAGSTLINAGIDVGLTADILGNAVGVSPDIGAYEYTV